MTRHVAFLRAINVAGHARVTMDALKKRFAAAGCEDVRTCLHSGNVLFILPDGRSTRVFERIRSGLRRDVGADLVVLFRTWRELEGIARDAPFREFEGDPDVKCYVAFLSARPARQPTLPLVSLKERLEAIALGGLEVFLVSRRKANGGYGFPNNFIEDELRVIATTRNWSTVKRILQVAARGTPERPLLPILPDDLRDE